MNGLDRDAHPYETTALDPLSPLEHPYSTLEALKLVWAASSVLLFDVEADEVFVRLALRPLEPYFALHVQLQFAPFLVSE